MTGYLVVAETSVHVGEGSAVGTVDLPVARERLTKWPTLPASGLKGALRACAPAGETTEKAFGSPTERGTGRIGDATLLALPARLAKGGAALLTAPLALARAARGLGATLPIPIPGREDALYSPKAGLGERRNNADLTTVWIEDLDLIGQERAEVGAWASHLGEAGVPLAERLVVVHDDVFGFAARAWTELRHRNRLGLDGVVEDGALFTVECCPPGTVWWTEICGGLEAFLPAATVIVGGHKSVGLGRVRFHPWESR